MEELCSLEIFGMKVIDVLDSLRTHTYILLRRLVHYVWGTLNIIYMPI